MIEGVVSAWESNRPFSGHLKLPRATVQPLFVSAAPSRSISGRGYGRIAGGWIGKERVRVPEQMFARFFGSSTFFAK